MKLKYFSVISSIVLIALVVFADDGIEGQISGKCEGNIIDRTLCQKMINLRSMIFSLEAQREMMQVNPGLIAALGNGLVTTAEQALDVLGPDLPEHRVGLLNLIRMSEDMTRMARRGDGNSIAYANTLRTNCATCHTPGEYPPGEVNWDNVFSNDWGQLNQYCRMSGKNPYLCKSMYALLSTQAYNQTSFEAMIENFNLTFQVAKELLRIFEDLESKGFHHLPEKERELAQVQLNQIMEMAQRKDKAVFQRAKNFVNTCNACHSSRGDDGTVRPRVPVENW